MHKKEIALFSLRPLSILIHTEQQAEMTKLLATTSTYGFNIDFTGDILRPHPDCLAAGGDDVKLLHGFITGNIDGETAIPLAEIITEQGNAQGVYWALEQIQAIQRENNNGKNYPPMRYVFDCSHVLLNGVVRAYTRLKCGREYVLYQYRRLLGLITTQGTWLDLSSIELSWCYWHQKEAIRRHVHSAAAFSCEPQLRNTFGVLCTLMFNVMYSSTDLGDCLQNGIHCLSFLLADKISINSNGSGGYVVDNGLLSQLLWEDPELIGAMKEGTHLVDSLVINAEYAYSARQKRYVWQIRIMFPQLGERMRMLMKEMNQHFKSDLEGEKNRVDNMYSCSSVTFDTNLQGLPSEGYTTSTPNMLCNSGLALYLLVYHFKYMVLFVESLLSRSDRVATRIERWNNKWKNLLCNGKNFSNILDYLRHMIAIYDGEMKIAKRSHRTKQMSIVHVPTLNPAKGRKKNFTAKKRMHDMRHVYEAEKTTQKEEEQRTMAVEMYDKSGLSKEVKDICLAVRYYFQDKELAGHNRGSILKSLVTIAQVEPYSVNLKLSASQLSLITNVKSIPVRDIVPMEFFSKFLTVTTRPSTNKPYLMVGSCTREDSEAQSML